MVLTRPSSSGLGRTDKFFQMGPFFISQPHLQAECFIACAERLGKFHLPRFAIGGGRVSLGIMLPEGDGQIFSLTNKIPVGGGAVDNIDGVHTMAGVLPKLQLC